MTIEKRFDYVKSLVKERAQLKATIRGIEKFNKEKYEEGRLPKPDYTLVDNMKKYLIRIEVLLEKHLPDIKK